MLIVTIGFKEYKGYTNNGLMAKKLIIYKLKPGIISHITYTSLMGILFASSHLLVQMSSAFLAGAAEIINKLDLASRSVGMNNSHPCMIGDCATIEVWLRVN